MPSQHLVTGGVLVERSGFKRFSGSLSWSLGFSGSCFPGAGGGCVPLVPEMGVAYSAGCVLVEEHGSTNHGHTGTYHEIKGQWQQSPDVGAWLFTRVSAAHIPPRTWLQDLEARSWRGLQVPPGVLQVLETRRATLQVPPGSGAGCLKPRVGSSCVSPPGSSAGP